MKSRSTDKQSLPVHSLEAGDMPVFVREIGYANPYDFTREHRHDYFEILFFDNGGGLQLIDFREMPVIKQSCYIVFPRQIHLLRRTPSSNGMLVQFREESIPSTNLQSLLSQVFYSSNAGVFYENDPAKHEGFRAPLQSLQQTVNSGSPFAREISLHQLQALLFMLAETRTNQPASKPTEEQELLNRFREALENRYENNHAVQHYTALLGTTDKKLAAATKKLLGLSPLQVIHNRILLEARRLLLFDDISHKEIAFRLGFDSPASFSQFIRKKTGHSPSSLHEQLAEMHK